VHLVLAKRTAAQYVGTGPTYIFQYLILYIITTEHECTSAGPA